ncbi:MAG: class I SAM-dependent methyltransferase, partial [Acidobacteriota bacterium]|nr:class I SAM-dependent methyltransferase [Acidobacteriota bacterium]
LSDERLRDVWPKVLLVHARALAAEEEATPADEEKKLAARAAAHFACDAATARRLEEAGLECWLPLGGAEFAGQAERRALGIAQALSLFISAAERRAQADALHRQAADASRRQGATEPFMPEEKILEVLPDLTVAREDDLSLTEFAAFNHGRDYPRMRRWELPFALFKARLSSTCAVLDCTINPLDFGARLQSLYPHALYRHWNPVQQGRFVLPVGVPDAAFDRVVCVNTLEHLLREQREALVAELALKMKPGGLLVVTSDFYFEDFWSRPELQHMGVMHADRAEIFNGWNLVTPDEILSLCARHNLRPLDERAWSAPAPDEEGLYRNVEPYPHACVAAVFKKGDGAALLPERKKVALSLLTWNMRRVSIESLAALTCEAAMLKRLGHEPFVIVCDNGSTDGLQDALRE